jgi:hypothetical protein
MPSRLAARHRQVARRPRACAQHDCVELRAQLVRRDVAPDLDAVADVHALGDELLHAALDRRLLDLELRHAEAHEPAGGLVALEQHDRVARTAQLLRGGHARGAGADDGNAHPGLDRRRLRLDPALAHARSMIEFSICLIVTASPSLISSTHDASHGRRAQAAGELGEVVGRVQLADRVLPAVAVDEVVPVGIRFPSGQPLWQNGTPHSMQRAPCCWQLGHRLGDEELAQVARALDGSR